MNSLILLVFLIAQTSIDLEIEKALQIAQKAYSQGAYQRATLIYKKALNYAKIQDNPSQIALSCYHLAVCYVAIGDYSKADECLNDALFEHEYSKTDDSYIYLLKARLYKKQGNMESAKESINKIVNKKNGSSLQIKAQAYLLLADILCESKDFDAAEKQLKNAEKSIKSDENMFLKAKMCHTKGHIFLMKKNPIKAAQTFDKMIEYYKLLEDYREMCDAFFISARAYLDAQKNDTAANRYFRGIRSLIALNQHEKAKNMLKELQNLQDSIQNVSLKKKIQEISEDLEKDHSSIS